MRELNIEVGKAIIQLYKIYLTFLVSMYPSMMVDGFFPERNKWLLREARIQYIYYLLNALSLTKPEVANSHVHRDQADHINE